jgi:hypothetical protein
MTRRLRACVENWPDCQDDTYDPHCCRFPKVCSCATYDERYVTENDLEPPPEIHWRFPQNGES